MSAPASVVPVGNDPYAYAAPVSGNAATETSAGQAPQIVSTSNALEVLCGPLLNYKRMSTTDASTPLWHGSVLIVTKPGDQAPTLRLRCAGRVQAASAEQQPTSDASPTASQSQHFTGEKLYQDANSAFWRFSIHLPLQDFEAEWEYTIPNLRALSGASPQVAFTKVFAVPSASESMRIMFHSCNGFSVGTDEEAWSGCALWNDVLRKHEAAPFHVMIGGGDQIYNDGVRVDGPLKPWTDIRNPIKRRDYPFGETMRADCDQYYFDNYVKWYSTEPFAGANAIIPQLNIWDDHDIIDGFGSYTHHFMKCAVFRGIGGVAHKYYLLFQHHVPPPKSTFTTDAPATMAASIPGEDEYQVKDAWVLEEKPDPSFILGDKPGPYVEERSTSVYCQLGARMAFLGIDARTERTRHQINYPETYDKLFRRVSAELEAQKGQIKHFILLLGVPIAYPRLQWLENILQSPLIGPIKLLNKRFGVAGGLFNQFDGNVDLLDDLDDHYTAHQHKRERKELILRLQELSKKFSVRVTILGGDVHLAAHGRFYSKPALKVPIEQDFRYMPNVISSAITNHPPPAAVANILARRNKIHRLDHHTHETLLNLFDKDPGVGNNDHPSPGAKTANANNCTMPSRNYAIISESHAHDGASAAHANGTASTPQAKSFASTGNERAPIHSGEAGAGTAHPAADGTQRTGLAGPDGIDVTYRVEINHSDTKGWTEGYGVSVPALTMGAQGTA